VTTYLEALGLLFELQRMFLAQLMLGTLHILPLVGKLGRVLIRQLFFPGIKKLSIKF
jgi:hypothetical protein